MIVKTLGGKSLDSLTKGSHEKIILRCDNPECNFEWTAEYRRWFDKKKHFCKSCSSRGRKHSFATKERLSCINRGKRNPNYKDGRRAFYKTGRENVYYREWRQRIFDLADGLCEICGEKGEETHHHVMPYKEIVQKIIDQLDEYDLETQSNGFIGALIGKYHMDNDIPGMCVCNKDHLMLHHRDKVEDSDIPDSA